MARDRQELHDLLRSISGVGTLYFQPPEGYKLSYPCTVYKIGKHETKSADNKPAYKRDVRYEVTHIGTDPDTTVPVDILEKFETSSFERRFISDGLIHDVLTIYF